MVTLNADELFKGLDKCIIYRREIVVVDAGSTDRTLQILKEFKVRLYKVKQNHLGRNKAKALALATGDLVLSLASDEIASSRLVRTI